MVTKPNITDLEEIVDSLTAADKALFQRIYNVSVTSGELCAPRSMQPWIEQQFGSVDSVTRQKIVRITNMITGEEALFNKLRASRPVEIKEDRTLHAHLQDARKNDTLRYPESNTPEDVFGRVVGKHCITASNIAKYDGLHGMVIFNRFNPLQFSREEVIDYIEVAREWAQRAHDRQPQAKYFLFIWNCLWRAGASIHHGHAQVLLTRDRHYARIEGLRQAASNYRQNHGSNYFTDLFQVHRFVNCAVEKEGVNILAHLTPFRNKEVVLMAEEMNLSLEERIYEVLSCLRDKMGVTAFNLTLVTPPLAETEENWDGFPVIARVVDRGDSNSRASDVGGMEIYASSVVSSDPFELARQLQQCLD